MSSQPILRTDQHRGLPVAVTVYEPDTSSLSCSGHAVLGSLNTCYNSSWDYYSVDECTVPTLLAATLSATATSSTAAATSTSASATASGAAGQAGAGGLSLSAGGLVGVVLGCTVGTAALLVGAFMLLRRRRSTSGRAAAAAAVAGAGSTPSVEQVQKAPPSGGGGGGGSGMSPGLSDWRMAPGYSAGSSSTMEQRGAGATYGKWHEVSEQGLAEAAYDSHFPVSRNVELPAEPAPNELSSHRYH